MSSRHSMRATLSAIIILTVWALPCAGLAQTTQPTITSSTGTKLRLIPAGAFQMGIEGDGRGFTRHFNNNAHYVTADEAPKHPVRLTRPFFLAVTEVTVGQFKQFVAEEKYRTTAEISGRGVDGFQPKAPPNQTWRSPIFELNSSFNWRNPGFAQNDNHPVVGVSWEDAQAFCAWLSKKEGVHYRLPTEAEWEHASRAGSRTWFSWGDEFAAVGSKANIAHAELEKAYPERALRQWLFDSSAAGDGHIFTAPVGSFPANTWGLHDMHGNVWEWCEDYYSDVYYKKFESRQYDRPPGLAIDPKNDQPWNSHGQWRVIRGGSWCNGPVQCRSGVRSYYDPKDAGCYLGFRVARDAPANELEAARRAFELEEEARQKVLRATGGFYLAEDGERLRVVIKPDMGIGASLSSVPALAEIIIQQGTTSLSAELIRQVSAVKDLTALVIADAGKDLTDNDFAPLASKTTLQRLEIRGDQRLGDGLLKHLAGLTNLKQLQLDLPGITDDGLVQLGRLKKLEVLHIGITASTGRSLAAFEGAPLRILSVSRLSDEHARHLRLFPSLRELNLDGGKLRAAGFAHVEALTRLERLYVRGCSGISDAAFAPLAKLTALRQLEAGGSGAGDQACAHLRQLRNLTELELNSDTLTDAGCEDLGQVVSLRTLTIGSRARISDAGLSRLWRLNRLESASIAAPRVTGSSIDELADLRQLRQLTIPAMTDAGLGKVVLLARLEHLSVGNWQGERAKVSDDGLLILAGAPKLRALELIHPGPNVTDAGLARLRQAAPALVIQVRQ